MNVLHDNVLFQWAESSSYLEQVAMHHHDIKYVGWNEPTSHCHQHHNWITFDILPSFDVREGSACAEEVLELKNKLEKE